MIKLSDWLKSTIPGIIVLGALGSIVALLLIKGISALVMRFLPESFIRTKTYFAKYHTAPEKMLEQQDTLSLFVYVVFHGVLSIWWIALASSFITIALTYLDHLPIEWVNYRPPG